LKCQSRVLPQKQSQEMFEKMEKEYEAQPKPVFATSGEIRAKLARIIDGSGPVRLAVDSKK
jgi:hypothetical protein